MIFPVGPVGPISKCRVGTSYGGLMIGLARGSSDTASGSVMGHLSRAESRSPEHSHESRWVAPDRNCCSSIRAMPRSAGTVRPAEMRQWLAVGHPTHRAGWSGLGSESNLAETTAFQALSDHCGAQKPHSLA